jgi:hypothetical protein
MKRLALVLAVLAGSLVAKAQNQPLGWGGKIVTQNNKLTFNLPVMALIADTTFKASKGLMYANIPVDKLLKPSAIAVNPDNMPIAKPANTDKRMPIIKPTGQAIICQLWVKKSPKYI